MNILLWVLQGMLALVYFAGGSYKTFKFAELAGQLPGLPLGAWRALGVIEMLGAVLLIIPAATKWMPNLTPIAAAVLAVETLGLAALYGRYSLKMTAQNPLIWAVVMGLLVAFVAYGRFGLRPVA
jgi:hypothetical protein